MWDIENSVFSLYLVCIHFILFLNFKFVLLDVKTTNMAE
jgi:hypothetical protein